MKKNLKVLGVFSVIRLEGEVNFFTGKFLQVLYFPSTAVVKIENLEEGFLRSIFSIFCFQSLGIMTQFFFKSRVGNETWLKKSTEVSNYGKCISNIWVLLKTPTTGPPTTNPPTHRPLSTYPPKHRLLTHRLIDRPSSTDNKTRLDSKYVLQSLILQTFIINWFLLLMNKQIN